MARERAILIRRFRKANQASPPPAAPGATAPVFQTPYQALEEAVRFLERVSSYWDREPKTQAMLEKLRSVLKHHDPTLRCVLVPLKPGTTAAQAARFADQLMNMEDADKAHVPTVHEWDPADGTGPAVTFP